MNLKATPADRVLMVWMAFRSLCDTMTNCYRSYYSCKFEADRSQQGECVTLGEITNNGLYSPPAHVIQASYACRIESRCASALHLFNCLAPPIAAECVYRFEAFSPLRQPVCMFVCVVPAWLVHGFVV